MMEEITRLSAALAERMRELHADPTDPRLAPLDISAARRDLGWEPRFTIASAFADYLTELKAARAG